MADLEELVTEALDSFEDWAKEPRRYIAWAIRDCIKANPELVLRALGAERDDSRRTAFHDWWIVPTERTD